MKLSKHQPDIIDFLSQVDILVDGEFVLALKSYDVKFAGSSNQRIVDVPKSLQSGKCILAEKYQEKKEIHGRKKADGIFI